MQTSETRPIICVLGATGNQGYGICKELIASGKYLVRGLCRHCDNDTAKELKSLGVEMIHADLNNEQSLLDATRDAYGVYGVTNFWQPDIMQNPHLEEVQGKNLVDACVKNAVQHFVWSSLEDADSIVRTYSVPHFTNKNHVEMYANEKKLPSTFVYPGFYMQNLLEFDMYKNYVVTMGVHETVRLPFFDVRDTGKIVRQVFERKLIGHKYLMASHLVTVGDVIHLLSRELKHRVKYCKLNREKCKEIMGDEMCNMFDFFNTINGYAKNQEELLQNTHKTFVNSFTPMQDFVKENRDQFLQRSSIA